MPVIGRPSESKRWIFSLDFFDPRPYNSIGSRSDILFGGFCRA